MKYSKWIGLLAAITVVIVCCTVWVVVPSAGLTIGGMSSVGKHNFGRPGLMNIFCAAGAALFFMLPRIWAKRTNVFFCGFNIAWSIRNFILFSRCYAGDCPEKTASLYILLAASAIMLLMSFVPDISIQQEAEAAADTNKTTSL
ncbi:MAG TPA: hypothetical protein VL307_04570 [Chitinophagaceae bacterium]|nr:hypothetical protein [Chitinophagaceae bacterium]